MKARALVGTAALVIGAGALVQLAPPAAAATTFASTAASAGSYAAAHIRQAGVAVYDRKTGSLWTGGDASTRISAASTIKVFIAADLLYRNAHHTIRLSSYDYGEMTPMITRSLNSAADYLWRKYGGNRIVRDIIARYHLHQTALSPVAGFWGFTRMTAHDFALVLGQAANDPSVGPWLTTTMSHSQHFVGGFDQWFGIPASGIRPFAIKQGWTCCDTGDIMNSTGYVGSKWRYAIAIFSSGSSSHHRYFVNETARRLLPGGYVPGDPARNPFGHLERRSATGSTVGISGWTVDPDSTSTAVTVEVREGTHVISRAATNIYRADVNSRHHVKGNHGYRVSFAAVNGVHTYCVQYDNIRLGSGNPRSCFAITVNGSPRGVLESAQPRSDGSVLITGWTYDPDATATSLRITVVDNGHTVASSTDDITRPDIDRAFGITGRHGYAVTLPKVADGTHKYCVDATNVGPRAPDARVGCRILLIRNDPFGAVTSASASPGQIDLSGWAIDPNASSGSLTVAVSVDGQPGVLVPADTPRPDATYTVTGNHGFTAHVPVPAGSHSVVVTLLNLGAGTDVGLPAATVTTS